MESPKQSNSTSIKLKNQQVKTKPPSPHVKERVPNFEIPEKYVNKEAHLNDEKTGFTQPVQLEIKVKSEVWKEPPEIEPHLSEKQPTKQE